MDKHKLVISVKMDAGIFLRFAVFDSLVFKKRWISPVLSGGILLLFAAVSFSRAGMTDGAVLLGAVLLAVGLFLSAGYFVYFFSSVRREIKKYGLDVPKPVYTLTLTDEADGISVSSPNGETAAYEWERTYGLYRGKACSYLYITREKAFLLPDSDIPEGREALWRIAEKHGKAALVWKKSP